MLAPFRRASVVTVTDFVFPRSVRSPVSSTSTGVLSAGTGPKSAGFVKTKSAVGNSDVAMMRPRN